MAAASAFTLFKNARVYTMDDNQPECDAFIIQDDRFVWVGKEADIGKLDIQPDMQVDMAGKVIIPGLMDVHNHFLFAGRAELYELQMPPVFSLPQIFEEVRKLASTQPESGWIVGGCIGSRVLNQLTPADLAQLDEVSAGYPVILRDDSQHNRWVNSEVLARAGLLGATDHPLHDSIGRDDATGLLNGVLMEGAAPLADALLKDTLSEFPELDIAAAQHAIERLNRLGVTGFQDALCLEITMKTVQALEQERGLSAWIVGSLPVVEAALEPGDFGDKLFALRDQYRSKYFLPDAGKIFMDGVPTTKTSAMLEPYLDDEYRPRCFCGTSYLTVPQLARAIADAEQHGISVKVHCTGDRAVRDALDAIEICRMFNGDGPVHHIAHTSFVHPDDLPRFKALNAVADLSPMLWVPSVIVEAMQAVLPAERLARLCPYKDLLEAGGLMAGGSDWPVTPDPNPWVGIQGLVTRQDPYGEVPGVLGADQALDLMTALKAYTINCAKAMRLEDRTGSIETGKSAEFAVLAEDIFSMDIERLSSVKVEATFFAGQQVHGEPL